jgi:hypothetical protein
MLSLGEIIEAMATFSVAPERGFAARLTSILFLKSTVTRSESEQPHRIAIAATVAVKRKVTNRVLEEGALCMGRL